MNTKKPAAPDLKGQASVQFQLQDFEAALWNKGYNIYIDRFINCPCKVKGATHLVDCQNCGGTGYVLVERIETKGMLHSMNLGTQYKEWSIENAGNVYISTLARDKLKHMDRVTIIDASASMNQVLYPYIYDSKFFAYTIYDILEIEYIIRYINSSQKLELIPKKDYNFKENKIEFLNSKYMNYSENEFTISVVYKHRPQFHIVDINRDIINLTITDDEKNLVQADFPNSSVGRRSHFVLDENFSYEVPLFDNTDLVKDVEVCEIKLP